MIAISLPRIFTGKHYLLEKLCRFSSINTIPQSSHLQLNIADVELIKIQSKNILKQKLDVLNMISTIDYSKKDQVIFNSSVGGHIRHSLDHFQAIFNAAKHPTHNPLADYDTRARNTIIETDKDAAKNLIEDFLKEIDGLDANKEINISLIGETENFRTYQIPSYVARELSFASHHAIHHMSMVKLLLQSMKYDLVKLSALGMAPSTVKEVERNKKV
jgi:uncharacterized damage-inducible protein DinB